MNGIWKHGIRDGPEGIGHGSRELNPYIAGLTMLLIYALELYGLATYLSLRI